LLAAPILQEETFGNVLLEARDAGLPVVTFDRGGLPELVTDGETGVICRSADLDGLLEGLLFFLDHPERRDRASARSLRQQELAEEDCTPERFTASWTAIFDSRLAEPAMSGIIETSL
jgi:glycosyltransferase involved in cell wall biosynthesis